MPNGAAGIRTTVTIACLLAVGGWAVVPHSASGSIVRDPYTTWDPFAQQVGATYLPGGSALAQTGGGVVNWTIAYSLADGGTGYRYTSAAFIGNFVNPVTGRAQALCISALHNYATLAGPFVSAVINTGPNYLTDPGQVLSVESLVNYPGGAVGENTPDAIWIWLDGTVNAPAAVIGSPSGDLVHAGFAQSASQGSGLGPADGGVRAVLAPVDTHAPTFYSTSFYWQSRTSPNNSTPGLGRASPGDSGGAVFNRVGGQLVGMSIAGTNGTSFNGVTVYLDFGRDAFRANLAAVAHQCGPADVGSQGGMAAPEGVLDNNDFIVFIDFFFSGDRRADRGSVGGVAGGDGVFDNNDFIVYIDQFFAGCSG